MNEYDDLDTYNGYAVHDMRVDNDYNENTGAPDVLDEAGLDDFIENLNNWG